MMVKHFPLSRPIFVQSTSCLCCLSCTDPIQPCSIPSGTATTVQTPPKPSAFALKTLISWELGVRSVWAPGMKFASLGTSSHFLGSWKPKGVSSLGGTTGDGGTGHGTPLLLIIISYVRPLGLESIRRVSHILPASLLYLFLRRGVRVHSPAALRTNKATRQANGATESVGGISHQLMIRNAARSCLLPDIFKLARLCRRRPLESA